MSKHAWVSEGPLDYVTKSELGCAGVRACVRACVREWLKIECVDAWTSKSKRAWASRWAIIVQ